MWALSKAAGDSPRSPPPAAPFETNHCHLTSHLLQMWKERSSESFSHKFLPNRHSRFPRQANTITTLKPGSYNPEQNCFSAWGRLGNIQKQGNTRFPKTVAVVHSCWGTGQPCTEPWHWLLTWQWVRRSACSDLCACSLCAAHLKGTWFCAPHTGGWPMSTFLLGVASSFSFSQSARPHKGKMCQVMH